jgi:ABC-type transporter Mla MlaB component
MLRISTTRVAHKVVTVRLDGQITGRWVKLLQGTCERHLMQDAQVIVDLKNVSFADHQGIALLRNLIDRRVEVLNALPFIAEQMKDSR